MTPIPGNGSRRRSRRNPYTAFASTPHAVTARLVVRRVKDARYPDALFPVWRYHPFFTDTEETTAAADITHRRHALIGPSPPTSSRTTGAYALRTLPRQTRLNPVRRDRPQRCGARRGLAGGAHRRPRGHAAATHRPHPRRLARPQRRPVLHLPAHWPWSKSWLALWHNTIGFGAHHHNPDTLTTRRKARRTHRKSWQTSN